MVCSRLEDGSLYRCPIEAVAKNVPAPGGTPGGRRVPATEAYAAFSEAIREYLETAREVKAHIGPQRDQARGHVARAERLFRVAALTAPAEGESSRGFAQALRAIRKQFEAARATLSEHPDHPAPGQG